MGKVDKMQTFAAKMKTYVRTNKTSMKQQYTRYKYSYDYYPIRSDLNTLDDYTYVCRQVNCYSVQQST